MVRLYTGSMTVKAVKPIKTVPSKTIVERIEAYWPWLLIIIFAFIKIWIVSGQHLYFVDVDLSRFDNGLFIVLANNVLHGHWLGEFNNLTLSKGPFYPIFIAVVSYLRVPLLLAEQTLYIFACLAFLISISPIISTNKYSQSKAWLLRNMRGIILVALGILIIFNPITSDIKSGTGVIREGIYPALTLLTVSLFVSMFTYRTAKLWKYVLISIGSGLFFSAFWLTREEGIWIVPFIVCVVLYLAAFLVWQKSSIPDWKIRLVLIALPFVILWVSNHVVSYINNQDYGVNTTVEFKDPQFLSAYSALTRVQTSNWMPVIPVSKQSRQQIYEVSPAFSELQPYLEGDLGSGWEDASAMFYPQYKGEIAGGWFMWAFRDAVADAGYYSNGDVAMGYYSRLANEVNTACSQGKLSCVKSTDSMIPPLNKHYVRPFISTLGQSFSYLLGFKEYNPIPANVSGSIDSTSLISSITHEPATNSYSRARVQSLTNIGSIYQVLFPVLTYLSVIAFILMLFFKRSYKDPLFIIAGLVGMTTIVGTVIIALLTVTTFPAISTLYFSSTYPFLIIFDVLSLALAIKFVGTMKNLG